MEDVYKVLNKLDFLGIKKAPPMRRGLEFNSFFITVLQIVSQQTGHRQQPP